jgi:thiamine transport system permease protein
MSGSTPPANSFARHRTAVLSGWLAQAAIVVPTLLCAGALLAAPGAGASNEPRRLLDPYILQTLRFTLWQAGLSTMLSIALAIPVARALARRERFRGRGLIIKLFTLPLGVPQIVAVLGILSVWGRQGWINDVLNGADLAMLPPVFGLAGILLAHVFFNLPLAVRYILASLDGVPQAAACVSCA